jgi:hypothetical protein
MFFKRMGNCAAGVVRDAWERRDNSGKRCCRAIVGRLAPLYGSRRDEPDLTCAFDVFGASESDR